MTYMGVNIYECERVKGAHAGKWIVQTYHSPTGVAWADDCCPHYPTLKAAKEAIREARAYEANLRVFA